MRFVFSKLAVVAISFALPGSALSHGCEDHLPVYLQGYYEGGCDEATELAQGRGEAKGADSYAGDWVQGQPSGKGVYVWENGARYEGEFTKGKVDGKGQYTSSKGTRYEGGFVSGKLKDLKPADCPTTPGPLNC